MYTEVEKPVLTGSYTSSCYYRDYRYLTDENTVLNNPHKGWYWHFIDNGCGRSEYRSGIGEDRMTNFPGLHHLYLRIDWADIEKTEGFYDWSYMDEIFDTYAPLGYRFTFRVCTYEGGSIPFATPEWVKNCGAKGWVCQDGSWQPDYGDTIYLEKLERFMREFGRKYNYHSLVEFVDVGTYGTWGEGHTEYSSGHQFPVEVLIKHINLHLKYFPDKYVLVNDDMMNSLVNCGARERRYLMDYCIGKGLGLRDDSILCGCYADSGYYGYDTMRTPFMFDEFYEFAPVDLELQHLRYYLHEPSCIKSSLPVYEALRRAHATYCGFHGYPRTFLEGFPYMAEHLANKLGYWYFVNGAVIPECISGLPSVLQIWFENKGFCHAYHPFTLKVKLTDTENRKEYIVCEETGKNLNWKAESVTMERITLSLTDVESGNYIISLGLFEGDTPIQLGFKKECQSADGFYQFDSVEVRKG